MKTLLILIATTAAYAQSYVAAPPTVPTVVLHAICGTHTVSDIQTAIDTAASTGAEGLITIDHTCTWSGDLLLRWSTSTSHWITIQTDGTVPPFGVRAQPGDSYLAKIVSDGSYNFYYCVFNTPQGSGDMEQSPGHPPHNYRFIGLEMTVPNASRDVAPSLLAPLRYNPVFGTYPEYLLSDEPYGIRVEHSYIHGFDITQGVPRGILFDGRDLQVYDSVIHEIHKNNGTEANAIWGCPMTGNWIIENNDVMATGETLYWCGGDDPGHDYYSPGNYRARYNYVHKDPAWLGYTGPGGNFATKNLMEFKGGVDILIDSNYFAYNFDQGGGSHGNAILFTPRLDHNPPEGAYPEDPSYANHTVRNETFINNFIEHTGACFSIGFFDTQYASNENTDFTTAIHAGGTGQNVIVQNNLCSDVSNQVWTWAHDNSPTTFIAMFVFDDGVPSSPLFYAPPWNTGIHTNINFLIDHNTFVPNPVQTNLPPLSLQINKDTCDVYAGTLNHLWHVQYNIMPLPTGGDCHADNPISIPGNNTDDPTRFNHNNFISSMPQSQWDTAFPGQGNLVNTLANTDGRGANLVQLSLIKDLAIRGIRDPGAVGYVVPLAPTSGAASADAQVGTVAFTPAGSGLQAALYFTVTCASSTGGTTRAAQGLVSPIIVQSLDPGNTYTCTVSGVNPAGTGPASSASASFGTAAYAYVTGTFNQFGFTTSASNTTAISASAGDFIPFFVQGLGASLNITSCTSSPSNTIVLGTEFTAPGGGASSRMGYILSAAAGSTTITCPLGGGGNNQVQFSWGQFHHVGATGSQDVLTGNTATTTTTNTFSTFSTTGTDLVVACGASDQGPLGFSNPQIDGAATQFIFPGALPTSAACFFANFSNPQTGITAVNSSNFPAAWSNAVIAVK